MIPNTTFGTAIVIPSIPFNLTTTANDAGVTYTLWYKYVAPADEVLGVFGWGTGTGYTPLTIVSELFGGFPDQSPEDRYYPSGQNLPVQFHARAGKTYYFEFRHTGVAAASSTLVIDIVRHVGQVYPAESLMIPDDTWSLPGAILSPTTGEVLKFVLNFWSGESGTSSLDGTILTEDYNTGVLKLLDGQLNLIANIPILSLGSGTGLSLGEIFALELTTPKFYVTKSGGGLIKATIYTVSKTGIIGSTIWTLPDAGLVSIGVNQAETIAYITGQATSTGKVKKWDLINNIMLADHPTPAGQSAVMVLKNDNVVIGTFNGTTHIVTISEYNSADSLLHSYTFTNKRSLRFKAAADNPLSIWCWFEDQSPYMSNFVKLRLSDGVHLQDFTRTVYESGTSEFFPITANPPDRFGHSFSCPIFLLFQGTPIPPDLSGIYYINSAKAGVGTVPTRMGKHDSYYNDVEKKIPDPTVRLAYFGE